MKKSVDETLFKPEFVKKVTDLLDDAQRTGQTKGVWKQVQNTLKEAKLGWYTRVRPERAAISRRNRFGLGVTGPDAQSHGEEILKIGFHEVDDACAFEGDSDDEEQKTFEQSLVARSDGLIPPLEMTSVVVVGGNHTTVFLRQCNAGVEIKNDYLKTICPSGKLDKDTIANSQVCPKVLKQHFDEGIMYFVMHKHCPIVWPTLPDFVQLALNVEAKVARSDIEVMIQMYEKSKQCKQGSVDWGKIEAAAAQALPACVSMIPQVSIFLQTFPGEGLYGMAEWLSGIQATTAMIGKDFLEAINSIKFSADKPIIRLPFALIKAQKISPTVSDGIGKAISVA